MKTTPQTIGRLLGQYHACDNRQKQLRAQLDSLSGPGGQFACWSEGESQDGTPYVQREIPLGLYLRLFPENDKPEAHTWEHEDKGTMTYFKYPAAWLGLHSGMNVWAYAETRPVCTAPKASVAA